MADLREAEGVRPGVIDLGAPPTQHIADQLIAERGQKIVNSRLWPIVRPLLYKILRYKEAVRMADELGPLLDAKTTKIDLVSTEKVVGEVP